jgi:tetratricopeptide (TPR) repeat protein
MLDYLRGWNDATKENIRLAEKALAKAYMIHRSVPLAHVAESKIREVNGDLEGSIDSLNEALALDRNLADAYAHKANAKILLGKAEEAPPLLDTAIKLIQGDPELGELGLCYWFLGRAYFNMGAYSKRSGMNYGDPELTWRDCYEKAIESLKTSVQQRDTTWFTWAYLISAYALRGRLKTPDADVAVNKYRAEFQAHWPLDKIKAYYDQPKYRGEYPQLQAALEEYLSGLKTAHDTAGVNVP